MRAKEFVNEGNDREHYTGGSLGLPFPGTYEQEYNMFKRKGALRNVAMTTETLDSSYSYTNEAGDNTYYFKTNNDVLYKVYFQGDDLIEVMFSAKLPDSQEYSTKMTNTGDSRKVFGTVIKIIQDHVKEEKPKALFFSVDNSDSSRIRLYKMLLSRASKLLPDYDVTEPTELGLGKMYMLKRKR